MIKIIKHLVIVLVVLAISILAISQFLKNYTHHDEALTVPDFTDKTLGEVESICLEKNLRFVVKDTAYKPSSPKGSVIKQSPKAGDKVKENRRIYLTINSSKIPTVSLPTGVIGSSQKVATAMLNALEIKVSEEIEYKDDPTDAVLSIKYNGAELAENASIKQGSTVQLVVGTKNMNEKVEVPDLVNKSVEDASFILRANNLNLGRITNDAGESMVMAPNDYMIYKQEPVKQDSKKEIPIGSSIHIWVKKK